MELNKGKSLLAGAVVLFSGAFLTACGESKGSAKQELNWMTSAEIITMDPSKATDSTSFTQMENTMEGLYQLGKDNQVKQALATKAVQSKDGLTWTFTLRKNAKWSNGDPVLAKDFVYSWQRTVNPKTASQYSYIFSGIKNADAIVAGKKKASSLGVKAVGKYKLVVKLEHKLPYFKLLMAFPVFFPENQHAVEKYGSKFGTSSKTTVFNGPFVQKGWTGSNLSWKIVKNKSYWNKQAVKLQQVSFTVEKSPSTAYNLYQDGKLDTAILSSQASKNLQKQAGYVIRKNNSTTYMQFNTKLAKFKSSKLRQAVSMALNRQALAKTLGGGFTGAVTFTAADMTKVNGQDFTDLAQSKTSKQVTSYHKKLAQKTFKEALKDLKLQKLSFTLLTADDDSSKAIGEYIQSALETAFGKQISVKVQSLPTKSQFSKMDSGNFEACVSGWSADFADPISFLDCMTSTNSYNSGKWSNKQYDQLIAKSKTVSSSSQRMKLLAKAENILMTDQGVTPLVQSGSAWMLNTKVKGLIYNGSYYFEYAYLE
ncbi:peptide ABC transporter substrate-binding protein [Lactobacillus nasalidis]|uniref:peptide ABC transporter substrate-binding protein n=1 Tax=Lactobacillus nasalidis TaxID=2797258 RepID=UPI001916B237|nr:peptide ABC transporter substrate-binding protein [Lactobacillus nasalidis]